MTQQEVIKAFMRSLDNSTKSGAAAVDEAVKFCSNGKFTSMQNLINCFIRDLEKYGNTYTNTPHNKFLEDYCGIIMNNADTGAISGSDAGGAKVKTKDSIVPETGAVAKFPSGGKTTINGLTFHWPDRKNLTSDQQAIVDRIYTWWAKGALNLIQESYGLQFKEKVSSVRDISIKFYNAKDDILARVNSTYSRETGKTNTLTLSVNMHYYNGFNKQDVNGKAAKDSAICLDRTLAHEFVHAVMAANIDNFAKLPHFVKEGLAELVHGIDDERQDEIEVLATKCNTSSLREMFETELKKSNYEYDIAYSGGYMLFRYLAKQASTPAKLPAGTAYNAGKTSVTIKAPFKGTWTSSNFASTVRTIDASQDTNPITIKAGSYNSTIKAGRNGSTIYGQGGNDTIYGGAGKDVFYYGTGDGADTINNFQSGKDVLRFYNKAQLSSVATSGTNVTLHIGKGSVKLTGKTNQRVDITDVNGKNAVYYFGRQDKANTFVYGANQRYYGSAKYKDTLQVNTGASVSLSNTALYHDIDVLDAARSKNAVKLTGGAKYSTLYGSAQNDTLTAGSGGASLYGGKGNDTLYGGKGTDKFYWGAGLGNDTVYNYESNKDVIAFSAGNFKSGKASGMDVILTSNAGNTIRLKNAAGKTILVADAKGKITKKSYIPAGVSYNAKKTAINIKAPFTGTFDVSNFASTVRTIDASQNTNPVSIKAGKYNSLIKAGKKGGSLYGQSGNDTLLGGAGKDVFWYGTGDGNDTIWNFQNGKDVLRLYNKAKITSVTTSGWDVILHFGKNTVKLDDTTSRRIDITDANGKNMAYYIARQDKNLGMQLVYNTNSVYYGSKNYTNELKINVAATVSLANTTLFHDIEVLDATKSTGAVKLTGGAKASILHGSTKNDTLTAGAGGADLFGGKGNDTYYGGKGTDTFWWGSGLGDDIVYNYESNKDMIAFSAGSLKKGTVSGNDVILTSNAGNTLTLKNAVKKTIIIADTKGKLTRKTYAPVVSAKLITSSSAAKKSTNYLYSVMNTKGQSQKSNKLLPIKTQNTSSLLSASQQIAAASQLKKQKL